MPMATHNTIMSEKKCPAALMAQFIGEHMRLFDGLDSLKSLDDADQQALIARGEKTALRMQMTASEAISLAPARSLRGAVAKLIIALFLLGEVAEDNDMDPVDVDRRDFLSRTNAEDALNYIGRAYGITPENLGLGSYVAEGPSGTLQRARALLAKVAA